MNEIIKNDEMMCSDDFPESLKRFSENINQKNPGLHSENHNLYLLQTTDRDGNVTGEAYGMNLMTNKCFNIMYYTHSAYFIDKDRYQIYIGNGTDEPVLTNNALYSPITTVGSTYVSVTRSNYPFKYNSDTDIASVNKLNYKGYFNYNISGITEDKEITEIGYGYSTTDLYTHAKIYDSEGNPSSITKRVNERLTITMYISCCCKMSIIENAYNNKIYMFLNPIVFEPYSGQVRESYSWDYWVGGFGRDTHLVYHAVNNSEKKLSDNSYSGDNHLYLFRSAFKEQIDDNLIIGRAKINSSGFFLESNNQYVSNMIYSTSGLDKSNSVGSCRFYIIKPIQLSEPEELSNTYISSNSITSSLLSDEFGLSGSSLPCTNFNITSLSMYNHLTKEWDIEESYLNDPNTDYNSTFYIAGSLWITFQGKSITAYVFTNIRTDLPITSFNNSNIVLYATDKYWDTSTWALISHIGNVDESLQCRRYYIITNENLVCLYPQRNMVYHQITTHKDSYTLPVPKHQLADYGTEIKTLTNDKYGWIMSSKYLIYPNTDNGCVYYELTDGTGGVPNYTWRWTTEEGDRLIFVYRQQDTITKLYDMYIRIYDTTNPDSEPTYVDVKLDLPEQLNSYSMYCECTDSGMLVCKGGNSGKNHYMVIVDIYGTGEGPIQHRIDDVKIHWVLNRSDNVVYYKYDSINTYNIYDMRNQIITDSFTIPAEYTYSGIVGWKDFIYVYVKDSSDTYTTFYYNITDRKLQQLMISRPELNYTTYVRSVDECMIVGVSSPRWIWLFKASDPTNPTLLIDSSSYLSYYYMSLGSQLKYINDNKQLLFVNYEVRKDSSKKYCEISIFDIGYRLDTGNNRVLTRNSLITEYISSSSSYSKNGMTGFFNNGLIRMSYYGEIKWYPIENCVYHKIVGTTTTVQSYNNPKQLSELTFSLSVTNDMNRTSIDTPSSGT